MRWENCIGTSSLQRSIQWSMRIQGRQSNVGATFIDKDKLLGCMLAGLRSPGGSLLFVALGGAHRLFFASGKYSRSASKQKEQEDT